jgi:VWFA-related protein
VSHHPVFNRVGTLLVPALVSVSVLAGPAQPPAWAQSRDRVLYVSAVDRAGKPVEQLAPADVSVREDGVAREVLRVAPATDPLQIALVVDNSAVMTNQVLDYREALKAFVARFAVPNEVALITFGDRPTIAADYTSGSAVSTAVDRLFSLPNAGSYALDAVNDAARGLQKRAAERPVIVVVSSEGVEFSNLTSSTVIDAVRAANASLFVLSIDDGKGQRESMRSPEGREREIVWGRGTSDTGGRREIVLSSMGLKDALAQVADELLHQFKVVYSRPTTLIPPEKTVVSSARDGLTVRGTVARAGKGA